MADTSGADCEGIWGAGGDMLVSLLNRLCGGIVHTVVDLQPGTMVGMGICTLAVHSHHKVGLIWRELTTQQNEAVETLNKGTRWEDRVEPLNKGQDGRIG